MELEHSDDDNDFGDFEQGQRVLRIDDALLHEILQTDGDRSRSPGTTIDSAMEILTSRTHGLKTYGVITGQSRLYRYSVGETDFGRAQRRPQEVRAVSQAADIASRWAQNKPSNRLQHKGANIFHWGQQEADTEGDLDPADEEDVSSRLLRSARRAALLRRQQRLLDADAHPRPHAQPHMEQELDPEHEQEQPELGAAVAAGTASDTAQRKHKHSSWLPWPRSGASRRHNDAAAAAAAAQTDARPLTEPKTATEIVSAEHVIACDPIRKPQADVLSDSQSQLIQL